MVEESKTKAPSLEKYSFKYWCDELKKAKEDRSDLVETADKSINIFKRQTTLEDTSRQMSVWWSLVSTLMPAYFSRVPKVDVEMRKKRGDDIMRLAGIAWENATQFAIEEYFPFTAIGYRSVLQYLLAGEGILWARYQANLEAKPYKYALKPGEEYDGEGEVSEEEGQKYVKENVDTVTGESAILDAVNYKNYRESPAESDEEVTWKARRSFLDREECVSLFKEKANEFNYNTYPEAKIANKNEKQDFEGKAEIWEIWCKKSGKVYYLHQGADFLEPSEPPINFHGFWPCEVIKANIDPNSNLAFSDFKQLSDIILEVERLTSRIHATVQAIRANFLYDSILGDKVEDLLQGDLKGVPVTNSVSNKQRGRLSWSYRIPRH
jgi:hypothetical protein